MARIPKSLEEWSTEVSYVRSIDGQMAVHGTPGPNFNEDPKCFERYCKMQAKFCDADGYPELAYLIWPEVQ